MPGVYARTMETTRDGTQLSRQAGQAGGQFGRPVTEAELVAKYRQCAGSVLPSASVEHFLDVWSDLDGLDNIATLAAIATAQ